jgi:hypothetical protein
VLVLYFFFPSTDRIITLHHRARNFGPSRIFFYMKASIGTLSKDRVMISRS